MSLFQDYGYIIFPKGFKFYHCTNQTLNVNLFEKYNWTLFCTIGPNLFYSDSNIYEIELLTDYKLLTPFIFQDNCCSTLSKLSQIARNNQLHLPNDILDIKLTSDYRFKLVNFLRQNQVDGWFDSVERLSLSMEVCLFTIDPITHYQWKLVHKTHIINSLDIYNPILHLGDLNQYSLSDNVKDNLTSLINDVKHNNQSIIQLARIIFN